jgi:IS5 family transposase
MESMIGNTIERAIADAGYRGHNAPLAYKFKVYTAGQRRRVTPQIKREMKRRAAVEPVAISKPSVAWPQSSSRPPRRRCHQCRVRRRRIQLPSPAQMAEGCCSDS